jgi:2-hydroxy-3-oxopropionate reductase
MSDLIPLGLQATRSLREAARGADLILLSLRKGSDDTPNWNVVQEVVEGKGGILGTLRRGQIVVDTSTVPPWETAAMAKRLAKKGVEWMDVPISGAAFQAREGNMVFMAGGKKSVFNKIKPILDKVGKKTVYVGKNGAGAALKLVVNQTLFLNQAAAIEGLVHGLKAGLNPAVMHDALVSGAAGSDLLAARGKDMLRGDYERKGTVRGALKDLELALADAKRLGIMLPMAGLYHQLLLEAYYKGWEKSDATVLMRLYEELAGVRRESGQVSSIPQAEETSNTPAKDLRPIHNIAVIGIGAMGTPMTTFLLKAGYDVRGFDLVEKQMLDLVPLGLKITRSPREAAMGADLILLSLPHWDAVREVVEGAGGILESIEPGQVVIDTSTVPPWETKAMADKMAQRGIDWMDVPVSGHAFQARQGNLVFMVGGKRFVFDRIKPVLDNVGKKTVYVGKNGDAAMLKLVVNQTLYLNQASAVEGFTHGLKAGVNPEAMYEVLASGAAGSDVIAARGRDMLSGQQAQGNIRITLKDLGLALESGRRLGVLLPMAALYHQFILQALYSGRTGRADTAVMQVYGELSNIQRRS